MMNSKQCCEQYIPEELMPLILSRLPVKSVLRFRCVSIPWRHMIDHPTFARLHLTHYNLNRHHCHFIVVRRTLNYSQYGFRCASTFKLEPITTFRFSDRGVPSLQDGRFISNIDGLCLIKGGSLLEQGAYTYILWNPSIRKMRILPSPPKISKTKQTFDFGLGFDGLGEDYKHVRLVLNDARVPESALVYSVGTKSWKSIEFRADDDDGCLAKWGEGLNVEGEEPANVCVRGFLCILATVGDSEEKELVSFDLNSEIFASTQLPPLPLEGDDSTYDRALSLVDFGSSLAVVDSSSKGAGSVWVLVGLGDDRKYWGWYKRTNFALVTPEFDVRAGLCSFFYLARFCSSGRVW